MRHGRWALFLAVAAIHAGCPGLDDDDDDADDDDTGEADDDAGDDDSGQADDDTADDDDTAPPTGPYEVVLDHPMLLDSAPLHLSRLDAAVGGDGRVAFVGYDGAGSLTVCSFDGAFEGHLPQEARADLDLQCESFPSGVPFFYPRIALDDQDRPAVVWDQITNTETYGRYLGQQQLLFSAPPEIPSVNHPDIAFADGSFTAVSQWYWAVGRTSFTTLPADLVIEPDWDAGPDGSEHKAPTIAAGGGGGETRLAWAAYHGDAVHLKTNTTTAQTVVDVALPATVATIGQDQLQGYAAWPQVAVDGDRGVHLAWHDWFDTGGDGEFRGIEYRHLPDPDLTPVLSLFLDVPIGDGNWHAPSVAVDDPGDVVIAYSSSLPSGSEVAVLFRDAGAATFAGAPLSLEDGRMDGPYHPAAVGYGDDFWVLYNARDGNQVHAVRLARGAEE